MTIPFVYVDPDTRCVTTGAVRMSPTLRYGAVDGELFVAQESVKATVESPQCPVVWTVRVDITDTSPGFDQRTTTGTGTGAASVSQGVEYGFLSRTVPLPTRGASLVEMRVTYRGANGVTGCVADRWSVAPFTVPVEVAPLAPCVNWAIA